MAGPGSARPRGLILAASVIALATLAAYHNSLAGPFVLDDLSSGPGNPTIRQLWPLTVPLTPPHGGGLTVEGRPILNLSFALNYALSGTRVWSYHAVNLGIHLLAGLTLWGIVRRTLGRLNPGPWAKDGAFLAAAVALVWALHPLQTEAVTYVAQRAESLMGLFYLLTLYCLIRGAESDVERPWLILGVVACGLGMATKEVMVSAPVLVLLYDRTFLAGSFRAAWRRRRGFYLGLASSWLLLIWLAVRSGSRGGTSGFGVGVRAGSYWLTQVSAVAHYLRLALWPRPLVFDYGVSWHQPPVAWLMEALLLAGLAGGTVWAMRHKPALGFLGFWFFAILAPTSLVPGNRQTLAEHRMYLALAPLAVLAVLALHRLAGRRVGGILFGVWTVALLTLTVQRNGIYASELTLYADDVAHVPGNAFAQCNLGTALDAHGREPEAIAHFEEALCLRPRYPTAEDNLGNVLLRQGRIDDAIDHYRTALRLEPGFAEAEDNLGAALWRAGRGSEAAACFREAVRLDPDRPEARNNLGNAFAAEGRGPEAMGEYEAALKLDPGYTAAHYNLGTALLGANQPGAAALEFKEALRERGDYLPARESLGNALAREGRLAEAVQEYETALQRAPGRAVTRYNLGNALLRLNRPAEAAAQFQEALRLQPDFPAARAVLERLRSAR